LDIINYLYFKSSVSEFGSISSVKYENNIQEYYSSQSFAGTRLTNIPSRIPSPIQFATDSRSVRPPWRRAHPFPRRTFSHILFSRL